MQNWRSPIRVVRNWSRWSSSTRPWAAAGHRLPLRRLRRGPFHSHRANVKIQKRPRLITQTKGESLMTLLRIALLILVAALAAPVVPANAQDKDKAMSNTEM